MLAIVSAAQADQPGTIPSRLCHYQVNCGVVGDCSGEHDALLDLR